MLCCFVVVGKEENGDNFGGLGTFDAASTNNLSGPNTDAQIPVASAQNGVAVQFIVPAV